MNYVLVFGSDCDNYSNPKIYFFSDTTEAEEFTENCNYASDGLIYELANEKTAKEYAKENFVDYEF